MTKYNDHVNRAANLRANGNNVKARMHEVHAEENYAFGASFKEMRQKGHAWFKSDKTKWIEFYKDKRHERQSEYDSIVSNSKKIEIDNVFREPESFKPEQHQDELKGTMHFVEWVREYQESEEDGTLYKLWRKKLEDEKQILHQFLQETCRKGDYCNVLSAWMQRIDNCIFHITTYIDEEERTRAKRGVRPSQKPVSVAPGQMNEMPMSPEARWGRGQENPMLTRADMKAIVERETAKGTYATMTDRINDRINAKNANGLSRGAFTEEGDGRPTAPLPPGRMNAMPMSSKARRDPGKENPMLTRAEMKAMVERETAKGTYETMTDRINHRINAKNANDNHRISYV